MFKPKMKETTGYRIKLVGNADTVKRMIASLYIVDAKKQNQIIKVCVCDDLPHVLHAVEAQQRAAPSHELLETGLTLQVGYGRSLTIAAKEAHDDEDLCVISPQREVVIPNHAVWEPNAAFATDFHIQLRRPHEDAALQISITSQDEHGSDIPLNVPPRIRLAWHPKDVAGVQRIRKTWEETEDRVAQQTNTLPRHNPQTPPSQRKSSSLPRYQQPMYQGIEKMLQDRTTSPRNHESTSPRLQDYNHNDRISRYGGRPVAVQDKNWNVVTSPTFNNDQKSKDVSDEELPQWAKGLGEQFDYDDVVVV